MISGRYWFLNRRFLPLFGLQALGAFADNLLKTSLTFLITYGGLSIAFLSDQLALLFGAGALVIPFIFFSGYAGVLSDTINKRTLIIQTRLLELGLALLALGGFYFESAECLLVAVLGYGIQSAFFGPAKYASLPDLVAREHLVGANAYFETSTFIAIILGVVMGGLLGPNAELSLWAGVLLIISAALSLAMSLLVPSLPAQREKTGVKKGLIPSAFESIRIAVGTKALRNAVTGLAYFWALGLIVLTLLPEVAERNLGISSQAATGLILAFVVGIGFGSFSVSVWLKGDISMRFVPLSLLMMALSLALLGYVFAHFSLLPEGTSRLSFHDLVSHYEGWKLFLSMILVAFFGGVFTVPLYALIQDQSPEGSTSRAVAGSNIIVSLVMVFVLGVTTLLTLIGLDLIDFIYIFSVSSFLFGLYALRLSPAVFLRLCVSLLLKLCFRVQVRGGHHLQSEMPQGRVIIANHVSFLDGVLLYCFLPGTMSFPVSHAYSESWWMRLIKPMVDIISVDVMGRHVMRKLVRAIKGGRSVVIFPEGRISDTGSLEAVKPGAANLALMCQAPLIRVRIEGAERSYFGRMKGRLRRMLFPKIRLTVMPPVYLSLPEGMDHKAGRLWAEQSLAKLMADMMYETWLRQDNLLEALGGACKANGNKVLFEDVRGKLTYRRLFAGALALADRIKELDGGAGRVGLMLPTTNAAVASFYACLIAGRVPAMINFTAGERLVSQAIDLAGLKTIISSRDFIEQARLSALVEGLAGKVDFVYLEDLRARMGLGRRLAALLKSWVFLRYIRYFAPAYQPEDEAVVLFTSGSDGVPKGVSLSHANLFENYVQVRSALGVHAADRVLSVLPVFHAFGLYVSFVLAPLTGARTYLYPSPLHYRIVPALTYDWDASVFFAADTFLANYARVAKVYDFSRLRLVVAGAEKLKETTRDLWIRKFGLRILEGYGVTEASPAIAVNTPIYNREGTVGQVLPGIETRLESVEGLNKGGKLLVRGGNIMRGYIDPNAPKVLIPLDGGWYDTGDIVTIDEAGFLTILGRVKRFAKIGGEMVSLGQVEALVSGLWPDDLHAATVIDHAHKGEQVILLTTHKGADLSVLKERGLALGMSPLSLPSRLFVVDEIPLLGSGKIDFPSIHKLASQLAIIRSH